MTTLRETHFVLRGWHVLSGLVAFFGTIVAVNVYFAITAVGTFPGEDVTHPYIQGLEYNRTLSEHRTQQEQGWRVTAGLEPQLRGAMVVIELHQRNGAPLTGAQISGALRWPADARRDRILTFRESGNGHYIADLTQLSEGSWDLRATATAPDHRSLDFEADLIWPLHR